MKFLTKINKVLSGVTKSKKESFISYIDKLTFPEIKEEIDYKKDSAIDYKQGPL